MGQGDLARKRFVARRASHLKANLSEVFRRSAAYDQSIKPLAVSKPEEQRLLEMAALQVFEELGEAERQDRFGEK